MNELRAEAERLLQSLSFEPKNQYEAFQIISSQTNNADTIFEDKTSNEAELQAFIDCLPSHSDTITLKLVRMHYHPIKGIKFSLSLFQRVWHSFRLDPYMICMFCGNVPGFHQLPASTSSPLQQFYLHQPEYWLLWSYDPSTLSTNAVFLSYPSPNGNASYPAIRARLERHKAFVGHPLFLALATTLYAIPYVDSFLREQQRRVLDIERYTGFSHYYIDRPRLQVKDAGEELDRLSDLSRSASSILVGLADMVQHIHVSDAMANAVLNSSLIEDAQSVGVVVSSEREMKNIMSILGPQLKETHVAVEYLKERARNQLAVTFNLLSRGDAQANIDLAKAAKLDSTSMKTIAIMTMGFLPATFYAALFAVPSLHWDQPSVIGNRFAVYWAFTIPTTLLVFAVWLGMMHGRELWEKAKERRGRAKTKSR
ncbi:hypothetical protein FGG08_001728 [Glutinoglossum americanum]|uniref:Uncharacterized protein n=1 Tax=Glutinoglossum americanum TaxID=1670608 RepID=A0A9P8IAH9_9PEZI|nr:hypothetical protein FGG08_001728 [Glutinoglossum americanum]